MNSAPHSTKTSHELHYAKSEKLFLHDHRNFIHKSIKILT